MNEQLPSRFTLVPDQWYAAEIISDEFGAANEFRSRSAIKVYSVTPAGDGRRRFTLSFYHANYPEGV